NLFGTDSVALLVCFRCSIICLSISTEISSSSRTLAETAEHRSARLLNHRQPVDYIEAFCRTNGRKLLNWSTKGLNVNDRLPMVKQTSRAVLSSLCERSAGTGNRSRYRKANNT